MKSAHCKSIAGLNRRWLVRIPRHFHPADMRKIDLVLPWCEARGAEHLGELAGSGLEERHLLLIVRPSAFSWPVYEGLALGGPLPTEAPFLPDGLSQVWLLTGLQAGGVVRGISDRGWYRDHLPEKLDELAV